MQGIFWIIYCCSFIYVISIKPENPPATPAKIEEIQQQEFIGSFDFDENDKLIFTHFPAGESKPAIIYLHKVVFETRSSKYKAIKYLNKNVKVKGNIIRLGDEEFIFVNQIEIMILEVIYKNI